MRIDKNFIFTLAKYGSLKKLGKPQEFTLMHGKCFVFNHKFKLVRAGVVASKYQCQRCWQVRNEANG